MTAVPVLHFFVVIVTCQSSLSFCQRCQSCASFSQLTLFDLSLCVCFLPQELSSINLGEYSKEDAPSVFVSLPKLMALTRYVGY